MAWVALGTLVFLRAPCRAGQALPGCCRRRADERACGRRAAAAQARKKTDASLAEERLPRSCSEGQCGREHADRVGNVEFLRGEIWLSARHQGDAAPPAHPS